MDSATITSAVERAALAAIAAVPIADDLAVGALVESGTELVFSGVAVSARFTGSISGEVMVAVEQAVTDALQNSPIGALDIAAALTPALTAAANAVGPVITGPAQALLPAPAVDALLDKPLSAVVALTHRGQIRALVGLALNAPAEQAAVTTPNYPTPAELHQPSNVRPFAPAQINRHGLEMLRDVAMEVTAQIGSTRMTVSELLALSDGAVIELDRSAGAPADLLVNGHLIARGEVVVIDENFGLRITEIVADEDPAAVGS
jgi:flagellar motor switch protein FliN/FliY